MNIDAIVPFMNPTNSLRYDTKDRTAPVDIAFSDTTPIARTGGRHEKVMVTERHKNWKPGRQPRGLQSGKGLIYI